MITKSEQCLTCTNFSNCKHYGRRDKILYNVKNNEGWKEMQGLINRYFKNGTISNNKIIDDLILALYTADTIRDFQRTFFSLLSDDLSSPGNCIFYKSDSNTNDDIDTDTIKW